MRGAGKCEERCADWISVKFSLSFSDSCQPEPFVWRRLTTGRIADSVRANRLHLAFPDGKTDGFCAKGQCANDENPRGHK